jgi:glutamate racemase
LNFMEKEKPIGVFDSGIGGLTVVKRLASTLPRENIVYFGDTARVPYGSKSNSTVIEYAIQDARFLMNKNVKAIVVACNTVSSVAMGELAKTFNVPIIGMIEPGANFAISHTKNGRIGVIGTRATINNQAYSQAIKRLDSKIEVYEKACPLFVPLAEEGWIKEKATYEIAEYYLKELRESDIDTLVLGCTHYPILAEVIQDVIGKNVTLVDSGIASAEVVKNEIGRVGFETNSNSFGHHDFYVSDIPITFKEVAELFLGRPVSDIHKVEIEHIAVD